MLRTGTKNRNYTINSIERLKRIRIPGIKNG